VIERDSFVPRVLLLSFPEEFVALLLRIEVSTNFADLIEVIKDNV